jgi:hypothetical protein
VAVSASIRANAEEVAFAEPEFGMNASYAEGRSDSHACDDLIGILGAW